MMDILAGILSNVNVPRSLFSLSDPISSLRWGFSISKYAKKSAPSLELASGDGALSSHPAGAVTPAGWRAVTRVARSREAERLPL